LAVCGMTESRDLLIQRLKAQLRRYEELGESMANPDVIGDSARLRRLAQEHSDLRESAEAGTEYFRLLDQLRQAREVAEAGEDAELTALAAAEVEQLTETLEQKEEALRFLLIPKDPLDDRPAVVEIRAGTGGDEAGLFAADLYRMYSRYASDRGWTLEILSSSEGVLGGLKEIIFTVRGKEAFGRLRYESGVHRVQRVPETESSGRIHTSAATVAVLPEAEEVDVVIDPNDLKVDVFRSSGPGGQSVNTTDSAVRITHLPTGLVVSCQDEKSQHKNKAKALRVLRSRLLDREIAEAEAARARERRLQVGTGDRSAKIRTYNFPQNRVTDHRINFTSHRLEQILGGDLDELIEALRVADQEEKLEAAES
jgi:peptide chain release factor 1